MIGVVKIKDGLFICDEFGAQVSLMLTVGPRVCSGKQSHSRCKYRWNSTAQFLGGNRCSVSDPQLARRRETNTFRRSRKNSGWNFQIYWGSHSKPWECPHSKHQSSKSLLFCDCDLHYAQVSVEHYENARVFEFAQTRPGNETQLFAITAVVRGQTDCSRTRAKIPAMERVIRHNHLPLGERRSHFAQHVLEFTVWSALVLRTNPGGQETR